MICEQLTNKEIAEILGLSVKTVDAHREVLIKKIKSKNAVGLVLYAVQNNIINVGKIASNSF